MAIDLPENAYDPLVSLALEEDLGDGDRTARAVIEEEAEAVGTIVAREAGVLAGIRIARRVFEILDREVRVATLLPDGTRVNPGDKALVLRGRARALLSGERTALNFLGRLSGIATLTARYVDAARGTVARILDTRKTTPGLRALEKYAVAVGGGVNHRAGLYDAILLKSNHYALCGGDVEKAVSRARASARDGVAVIAEARNREEAVAAVRGGAEVVLFDNFDPGRLRAAVSAVRDAARACGLAVALEASGGITLENLRAFAETGVERISVGALTRAARSLDLSMSCEPPPQEKGR